MDKKTLKALKDSIAKWERNTQAITPYGASISADDCPLCDLFFRDRGGPYSCRGCPVAECTGRAICNGTPYEDAVRARRAWTYMKDEQSREVFVKAAQEEVDFLKSLLPK